MTLGYTGPLGSQSHLKEFFSKLDRCFVSPSSYNCYDDSSTTGKLMLMPAAPIKYTACKGNHYEFSFELMVLQGLDFLIEKHLDNILSQGGTFEVVYRHHTPHCKVPAISDLPLTSTSRSLRGSNMKMRENNSILKTVSITKLSASLRLCSYVNQSYTRSNIGTIQAWQNEIVWIKRSTSPLHSNSVLNV